MLILNASLAFALLTTAASLPALDAQVPPNPTAPGRYLPSTFADLVARLAPAVVNISTNQSIRLDRRQDLPPGFEDFLRQFGFPVPQGGPITQRGTSLGSGFVISPEGYIVTNNHVISPAQTGASVEAINVTLADGRELPARVVGRDEVSDLALLKIEARGLPFVRFGDSTRLRVGDWVVAIGNPFGLGGTVTAGIVSALHRNLGAGVYDHYIQTDAPINMGNSGGPMFDLNGNVVGITTAILSPSGGNIGLGFAIPAEQVRPIIDTLRSGQRVRRSYLGIGLQSLDDSLARALGLARNNGELVNSVTRGSPADRAGLRQGDVIIAVDGQPVTDEQTLPFLISQHPVGSTVRLDIVRDRQRRSVAVALGERPPERLLGRSPG